MSRIDCYPFLYLWDAQDEPCSTVTLALDVVRPCDPQQISLEHRNYQYLPDDEYKVLLRDQSETGKERNVPCNQHSPTNPVGIQEVLTSRFLSHF
ncbi:hypothetical protein CB1_000473011 [Camelus ferus]|nr:hypothetical protein CB1_000473011 [Camelus ferus]